MGELRKLNPRVKIDADMSPNAIRSHDSYSQYTLVVATDLPLPVLTRINAATRRSSTPFYAAASYGFYGYIFADLVSHEFVIEREPSNRPATAGPETSTRAILSSTTRKEGSKTVEIVRKKETYCPISDASAAALPKDIVLSRRRKLQVTPYLPLIRALWAFNNVRDGADPGHHRADLELFTTLVTQQHSALGLSPETFRSEHIRKFLHNVGSEMVPTTAFLGGQLAQDAINVLGQREQPVQNMLIFDGDEARGPVYVMHPPAS